MLKIKTEKINFGGTSFQVVYKVDSAGNFAAKLPAAVNEVLNESEVRANNLDDCKRCFREALERFEKSRAHDVKQKTIKLFNGRGHRQWVNSKSVEWEHIYIGAHSKVDAVQMMKDAGFTSFRMNELTVYYSKCWGTPMSEIEHQRGVWAIPHRAPWSTTPTRLL